jgi:predicted ester cyclase
MSETTEAIARHVAAFNAKDADAEPWSVDAELEAPVGHFRGRDEVLGFLRGYWDAFPDRHLEIRHSISEGSRTACEGVFSGTHTGSLQTPGGEVSPTERTVQIRWMAMYEARAGELVTEHLYFDQNEFLTQLGLAPGPAAEAAR